MKRNFPQQHILLTLPAAQPQYNHCKVGQYAEYSNLVFSSQLCILLETLLEYSQMLLGKNTRINADSVQVCSVSLQYFIKQQSTMSGLSSVEELGVVKLVTWQEIS